MAIREMDSWRERAHQQVLWFDVSVDNVQTVQVLDGVGQVVQHAAGVSLRVSVGGRDGVEKVAPLWTYRDRTRGALERQSKSERWQKPL